MEHLLCARSWALPRYPLNCVRSTNSASALQMEDKPRGLLESKVQCLAFELHLSLSTHPSPSEPVSSPRPFCQCLERPQNSMEVPCELKVPAGHYSTESGV